MAKKKEGGAQDVIVLINMAAATVAAVEKLVEKLGPIVDLVDQEDVKNKLYVIAEDRVSEAAKFFARIGDKRDEIIADLSEKKNAKELKKRAIAARQSVLESPTTKVAAAELIRAKEKAIGPVAGPISSLPGCFVIATYKRLDFNDDLTDYIGLYIGKADNTSEGVDVAISREGDPDVYADVKYKQNVQIFVYNCPAEELEELYEGIKKAFDGGAI